MKEGCLPPVGPDPGVGNRLLAPPANADEGVGIPGLFKPDDSLGDLGLVSLVKEGCLPLKDAGPGVPSAPVVTSAI